MEDELRQPWNTGRFDPKQPMNEGNAITFTATRNKTKSSWASAFKHALRMYLKVHVQCLQTFFWNNKVECSIWMLLAICLWLAWKQKSDNRFMLFSNSTNYLFFSVSKLLKNYLKLVWRPLLCFADPWTEKETLTGDLYFHSTTSHQRRNLSLRKRL